MKIWISGTLEEVQLASQTKLIDAIVTNPTVIADWTKNEQSLEDVIKTVTNATGLPLYIQLHGPTKNLFLQEIEHLKKISDSVIPKLPATIEGIMAAKELEYNGTETLITTVVSVSQAYACATSGVTSICPYLNRLRESGNDAINFIKNVSNIYQRESIKTKIIPASIRSISDIEDALIAGSSGVIIFYPLFLEMFSHKVMAASLNSFENDWQNIPYEFNQGENP